LIGLINAMAGGVTRSAGHDQTGRQGIEVIDGVAGGEGVAGIRRATGQGAATAVAQIGLNVGSLGDGGGRGTVLRGPDLLGAVNLAQVGDAGGLLGLQAGADEIRNGDGGQQADDGDNDHNFHERKPAGTISFDFHKLLVLTFPALTLERQAHSHRYEAPPQIVRLSR